MNDHQTCFRYQLQNKDTRMRGHCYRMAHPTYVRKLACKNPPSKTRNSEETVGSFFFRRGSKLENQPYVICERSLRQLDLLNEKISRFASKMQHGEHL